MKIRCLVVDDEPLAIKLMVKHIAQIESFELIATCNSSMKAFEILNTQNIDLLFLDIKMPSITGIDFLKSLKQPPKTIFTTAYRNYAIESYDLDIVDYLLKPITFDRFFNAVQRYFRENPVTQKNSSIPNKTTNSFIIVKSGNKYHKINTSIILYIESLKDYVKIYTENGMIISKYKTCDIENELADKDFVRIHRSYIINISKITAFTSHDIEIGEIEIPISASYKGKLFDVLKIK